MGDIAGGVLAPGSDSESCRIPVAGGKADQSSDTTPADDVVTQGVTSRTVWMEDGLAASQSRAGAGTVVPGNTSSPRTWEGVDDNQG